MTPDQIQHVQQSFAVIAQRRAAVAERFYVRLFDLDPSLRPMFPGSLAEQGGKLMATLALVVRSLQDLAPLLEAVDLLGRRHHGYGVKETHFATVGEALIRTLKETLGPAFTPEVEDAWTQAYTVLSARMIAPLRHERRSGPSRADGTGCPSDPIQAA